MLKKLILFLKYFSTTWNDVPTLDYKIRDELILILTLRLDVRLFVTGSSVVPFYLDRVCFRVNIRLSSLRPLPFSNLSFELFTPPSSDHLLYFIVGMYHLHSPVILRFTYTVSLGREPPGPSLARDVDQKSPGRRNPPTSTRPSYRSHTPGPLPLYTLYFENHKLLFKFFVWTGEVYPRSL